MVVQELIEARQFLAGCIIFLHWPIILNGLGLSAYGRAKTEKSCQSC
jgi:hypothetical protein